MEKESKTYNIKEAEEKWRKYWEKEGIYKFDEKTTKPIFSVDTPPPYVSADHLHQGHIMSYSQAEFVVRFKRMQGFEVYYPMGFDDNGLPTERFVEKKYNLNKSKISRADFIKKCLEETKIGSKAYQDLWRLLGISVDWSKTYSTIDQHSQKISQMSFLDLVKKGKMYRAKKPIMWCTTCQTAIAQADLEDEEKETNLVYIKALTETGEGVTFATTRPELLPSCVGMSIHPSDERYKHLVGKKVILPITAAKVELTTDEIVDPKFATGVVYFCSSGDRQFLDWELKHPIKDKIYLLSPDGRMNALAGKYQGLMVLQTREQIINDLQALGCIDKIEKITHSVNTHERCSTDIEFVDSEQWFIDVLNIKKELKEQADKMRWFPLFMKQKYLDWVSNLRWDWCISRQRYYGVPMPVWYCQKCHEIITPKEDELPVDPTLQQPKIKKCPKCGFSSFEGEKDVLDTWATSSLTPNIASQLVKDKKTQAKLYPATLRPQAFEIIRTWLFYTVVKSFYNFNSIPFKDIMISGHGVDKDGKKISKRLGNYTDPKIIIDQYGADALRYWATGAGLGSNLKYSEDEVKKGKRTVTKLFNAGSFCFSHFENKGFQKINFSALKAEDKWILFNLNKTIEKITSYFENYEYSKAKDEIDNFFWHYFCDNYLEFIKHRLYQDEPDARAKQVLARVLLDVLKIYAPLLPFITEELYQTYYIPFEKIKSIHLASWPEPIKNFSFEEKEQGDFENALMIIGEIRAYKSTNQLSQGTDLALFETTTPLPANLIALVQSVCKVKELKLQNGIDNSL
ncbi:MAG: valine--tRNA ligase [bacterium]|nr:valine--tRNA ligase [bacterium]